MTYQILGFISLFLPILIGLIIFFIFDWKVCLFTIGGTSFVYIWIYLSLFLINHK